MKAPKSMAGIFREIVENRADASQAKMAWGVYLILKSGRASARPSAETATEATATERAEAMARMNPGRRYVVKAL